MAKKPVKSDVAEPESTVSLPPLGARILYILSEADAGHINTSRLPIQPAPGWNAGAQSCYGNPVAPGDAVPADVTRSIASEGTINLKLLLDGLDTYWAQKVTEGRGFGQWYGDDTPEVDAPEPVPAEPKD